MIDDLDRRIAELQREEQETHRAYMALLFLPDQRYLESAVERSLEDLDRRLTALYRKRESPWGKHDDRILRDQANSYNPSEL